MKRTDLHRPSAIIPADYDFVACFYMGEPGLNIVETKIFREHMERTGGKYAHITYDDGTVGSTGCDICGARCVNTARFHHVPSNTYIVTGLDCAAKMDIGDPIHFASWRKRIAAGLKTARGKLKAQRTLAEAGLSAAWAVWEADQLKLARPNGDVYVWPPKQEVTIIDIVNRVIRYGEPSEGQANYLRSLLRQIDERPALEAKRAAEAAKALPVPQTDARVKIEGKVISTKVEDGGYGPTLKMLVQHVDGYRLWGTAPRSLIDEGSKVGDHSLKGKTVSFVARIQRSDRDDKFGFFSRPTNASVIKRAEETVGA